MGAQWGAVKPRKQQEAEYAQLFEKRLSKLERTYKRTAGHWDWEALDKQLDGDWTGADCESGQQQRKSGGLYDTSSLLLGLFNIHSNKKYVWDDVISAGYNV